VLVNKHVHHRETKRDVSVMTEGRRDEEKKYTFPRCLQRHLVCLFPFCRNSLVVSGVHDARVLLRFGSGLLYQGFNDTGQEAVRSGVREGER
jgi:hypothetical protein